MNRIILTLTVFAMIISTLIIVSDYRLNDEASYDVASIQQVDSVSVDDLPNFPNADVDNVCDKACGGCCFHYVTADHVKFNNISFIQHKNIDLYNVNLALSDFDYGLKRPPKSAA